MTKLEYLYINDSRGITNPLNNLRKCFGLIYLHISECNTVNYLHMDFPLPSLQVLEFWQ